MESVKQPLQDSVIQPFINASHIKPYFIQTEGRVALKSQSRLFDLSLLMVVFVDSRVVLEALTGAQESKLDPAIKSYY